MKKVIATILLCLITALLLTGCTESKPVNVENNTTISGTAFGRSALLEIGDGLWYDTTTRIVYWWNGFLSTRGYCRDYDTTPSPYFAPNGLPYRYNHETNTFEEISL